MEKVLAAESPYAPVSRYWNALVSVTGFKHAMRRLVRDLPIELLGDAKILEIGCGTGIIVTTLLKRFPDATGVATDIDENMLIQTERERVEQGIEEKRLVLGIADASRQDRVTTFPDHATMMFPPGSFDLIAAGAVLEHVEIEHVIPELLRLLKPGGIFLGIPMADIPIGRTLGRMFDFRPIPIERLLRVVRDSGGEDVEIVPLSSTEFPVNLSRMCFVARKI